MQEAGFVNVQTTIYKCPINTWPKGKKEKMLGLWSLANMLDGLEGFTMALFTRMLGWQQSEVDAFLVDVRKAFKNRAVHAYFPV